MAHLECFVDIQSESDGVTEEEDEDDGEEERHHGSVPPVLDGDHVVHRGRPVLVFNITLNLSIHSWYII